MPCVSTRAGGVLRQCRGAVLVEFALLLPVLMGLLMGVLCYGQYIWVAHSAQSIANDAARATIAGLTPAERLSIAQGVMTRALPMLPELKPDKVSIALDEGGGLVTVRLRVDARSLTLLHMGFVPLPDAIIDRRATVPLGGA